jgi:Rrf2 family protein
MLLTKASEYALLSLAIISKEESPINADRLSKQLNMSKSFLAKVLQSLAREGILNSYKGASGGFVLAVPKEELTIYQVVSIVEDRLSVFECTGQSSACPSGNISFCQLWPILTKLQDKIDDFLKELTLADLIQDIG